MRFFFYGTLMDESVRAAVLGAAAARALDVEPATLSGWRRVPVRGRSYPIILPAAGHSVSGVLADRVDEPAAARLDRFEGAEYRKLRVRIRRAAGDTKSCWVYAVSDAGIAGTGAWDFDRWRRCDRAALLRWLSAGRD